MEKSASFYAGVIVALEKDAAAMGTSVVQKSLPDIGGFLKRIGRGKAGGAPVATKSRPLGMVQRAKPGGLPFQAGLQPTPQGAPVRGAAQNIYKRAEIDKEALLGFLKKKAPSAFKPSFAGHSKAIQQAVGSAKKVDPRGIVTQRKFNPMSQNIQQKSYVTGVPGWTA